jgi:hypothetical protein
MHHLVGDATRLPGVLVWQRAAQRERRSGLDVQDVPKVQVAADDVVQVGHQVLDLAPVEPPHLYQLFPKVRIA